MNFQFSIPCKSKNTREAKQFFKILFMKAQTHCSLKMQLTPLPKPSKKSKNKILI